MTLGFPTIVIPTLQGGQEGELVLTPEQISWISSINLICVPLGCLLSGAVTQPLGRKKSMQLVNLPFVAAWLLFHAASSAGQLYAALALTGLGGGLMEAPVITYVAEITQPKLRGMLAATSSMTIIFGVFVQFLLGTFLYWRTIALLNVCVPILAIGLLFIVPESPHWLVINGRTEEAKKSLAWLRGWTTPEAVSVEHRELCLSLGKDPDGNASNANSKTTGTDKSKLLNRFGSRSFVLPYMLVAMAFFLGHFSGMTTLQTFAVQIFERLRAPIDRYYATLLLGIVELFGSLLCVILVHRTGRRPLTFLSTIGCGICFITVATYAYLIDVDGLQMEKSLSLLNSTDLHHNQTVITDVPLDTESLRWLPTTLLIGSAFLSHAGIRLLPWVLIGEVYPTDIRGIASGLSGGLGYIFGFAANKSFFATINTLTLPGTFWLYGAVSLIGTVILYFTLPETEGRTLLEIEHHFSGVRNLKQKVPLDDGIHIGQINEAFNEKTDPVLNNENAESRL